MIEFEQGLRPSRWQFFLRRYSATRAESSRWVSFKVALRYSGFGHMLAWPWFWLCQRKRNLTFFLRDVRWAYSHERRRGALMPVAAVRAVHFAWTCPF